MPYADLPAFMAKLSEINTTASRALAFTILTCARTSETINATWDEIDFQTATWGVAPQRMKMQKPRDVPLSEPALNILGDQLTGRNNAPVRQHELREQNQRARRAMIRATDICAAKPDRVAQRLVDRGFTPRYDYVRQGLDDVYYRNSREYDPEPLRDRNERAVSQGGQERTGDLSGLGEASAGEARASGPRNPSTGRRV
jgi:integrase